MRNNIWYRSKRLTYTVIYWNYLCFYGIEMVKAKRGRRHVIVTRGGLPKTIGNKFILFWSKYFWLSQRKSRKKRIIMWPCGLDVAIVFWLVDKIYYCNDLNKYICNFESLFETLLLCMTDSCMMNNRFVPLLWFLFFGWCLCEHTHTYVNGKRVRARARAIEILNCIQYILHHFTYMCV